MDEVVLLWLVVAYLIDIAQSQQFEKKIIFPLLPFYVVEAANFDRVARAILCRGFAYIQKKPVSLKLLICEQRRLAEFGRVFQLIENEIRNIAPGDTFCRDPRQLVNHPVLAGEGTIGQTGRSDDQPFD